MVKVLHIDANQCTGCHQCEMACSYHHEGIFNPAKSRIRIFKFEETGRNVPYTCTQCAEAWCLQACPVDAISINQATGAKEVSNDLCVGCKVCTIACPFGTIFTLPQNDKAAKCNLCGGDPACAVSCPTNAIEFIDTDDAAGDWFGDWGERVNSRYVEATAAGADGVD